MYIMSPHSSKETYAKTNKKVTDLITNNGGEILLSDDIGMRDLATEFNKLKQGYYMRLEFNADVNFIGEFNEKLRIDEVVFRYLITTLDTTQAVESKKDA